MPKFDAAQAVDPLEIDWSKYNGPVGVIPEPSTDQITAFQTALIGAAKTLGITPGKEIRMEDVVDLPDDAAQRMAAEMKDALVKLCGGFITEEDYDRLPYRVQAAFNAWIAGELRPEAVTPGITR